MDDQNNYKWFAEYDLVNIERFIKYVREAEVPHKEEEKSFKNEDDYDKSHKVFDVDELARDFKSFFVQYDKRRNKNFVETFPRLADWYNSL
jgi:hypothetical protein